MVSKRCEARIKVLFDSDYSFVGVPQRYICGLAEIIEDGLDRGPRQKHLNYMDNGNLIDINCFRNRIAAFHSSEVCLFGHSGDFADLVVKGDVLR